MSLTAKQIEAKIKMVRTTGDAFNTLVHETALAIFDRAEEHGDCSQAQHLLMAMPASMRRTMLALWFHTFTPIVVKEKDPSWNAKMHKKDTKLYVPFDRDAAVATPWYTLAEQNPEAKTVGFVELLLMVKNLSKQIAKKIEKGVVLEEDIPTAQAMAAQISSLHFSRVEPKEEPEVVAAKAKKVRKPAAAGRKPRATTKKEKVVEAAGAEQPALAA